MGVGPKTINIWHINWRLCRCHLRCHAGSGQNYLHHTPTLHHPKIFIRLFCSMGEYVWKGGGGNTTMTNTRIIFHLYWSHIVLLAIKWVCLRWVIQMFHLLSVEVERWWILRVGMDTSGPGPSRLHLLMEF